MAGLYSCLTAVLLVDVVCFGSSVRSEASEQNAPKLNEIADAAGPCRGFVHVPNSMILRGEIIKKVSEGYSADECKQACMDTTDFHCSAAMIQKPGDCFIAGYRRRNDYFSTHYSRICQRGPACFQKLEGISVGLTDGVQIPSQYLSNPGLQILYCMARCELMSSSCIGFDFKVDSNKPRCHFTDLGVFPGTSFDLHIRRC